MTFSKNMIVVSSMIISLTFNLNTVCCNNHLISSLFLILVCHSFCFSLQGKAVQTAYSLQEGLRIVVPITNNKVIFQENNYKLVHLTGKLKTDRVSV